MKQLLKVDEARFAAMVDDWSVKLLKSYEEYKAKQEAIRAKQSKFIISTYKFCNNHIYVLCDSKIMLMVIQL